MAIIKRIIKGDTVKIISGAKKGTTGKVLAVLTKQNSVLIDGVGTIHRKVKPTQQNPRGGHKDIHVPTPIHKVALVIDEKTAKTSRVGLIKNQDGKKTRVARQNNNKEIK
jgi:large subunit ribosomal protein L24